MKGLSIVLIIFNLFSKSIVESALDRGSNFDSIDRSKRTQLYCVYNYDTFVDLSELAKYCQTIIWRIRPRSYKNENLQQNVTELIGKYPNVTHHWLVDEQFLQELVIDGLTEKNFKRYATNIIRTVINYGFGGVFFDWNWNSNLCPVLYFYEDALDYISSQRAYHFSQMQYNIFLSGVLYKGFNCDWKRLKYANKFIVRGFMMDSENIHALQHYSPFESMLQKSIKGAVNCYVEEKNIPRERIILGLSTQGIVMKAKSRKNNFYYAQALGDQKGSFKKMVNYHNVCPARRMKENVTSVITPNALVNVIKVREDFISIENPETIATKCRYALLQGLGGVALFDAMSDDPENICNEGPQPLTQACYTELY